MKVWVVCTNDWPDAVFSTEKAAEAYTDAGNREQSELRALDWRKGHIRYHTHEFEVDVEKCKSPTA